MESIMGDATDEVYEDVQYIYRICGNGLSQRTPSLEWVVTPDEFSRFSELPHPRDVALALIKRIGMVGDRFIFTARRDEMSIF